MEPKLYYHDEFVSIYHGNWIDFYSNLLGDLLLTDPPYGINYQPSRYAKSKKFGAIYGDNMEIQNIEKLLSLCTTSIIWGANNFCHFLPKGGWIVWDKRLKEKTDKMLGSPFELAWCSTTALYRMIRIQHGGVINADSINGNNSPRFHPTQKPIALMDRCLTFFPNAITIVDPFCGSGTTLLAAKKCRRKAIGVEIEEKYCEISAKRLGLPVSLIEDPKQGKGFFR